MLRNKRGRDSERPAHRDEEWTPLTATRESPRTETNTQHSHKQTNKQTQSLKKKDYTSGKGQKCRLGIKSKVGIMDFSTSDAILGLGFFSLTGPRHNVKTILFKHGRKIKLR